MLRLARWGNRCEPSKKDPTSIKKPGLFYSDKNQNARSAYILVFILPLPSDIELLSFLLCFIARLSPVLVPSGAPVVKTSPDDTAPLGLLGAGAVPLGTVLGLAVLGVRGSVWAGVV
jgi:hypothetical protein